MYHKFLFFLSSFSEGDKAIIYYLFMVIFFAAISFAINVLMFSKEER